MLFDFIYMACLDKSYRGRNQIRTVMAWGQKKMAMAAHGSRDSLVGDREITKLNTDDSCTTVDLLITIIYFVVNILWYMKTYQNQANELQSDVSKPKRFKIIILNIMGKLEDSLEICLKE